MQRNVWQQNLLKSLVCMLLTSTLQVQAYHDARAGFQQGQQFAGNQSPATPQSALLPNSGWSEAEIRAQGQAMQARGALTQPIYGGQVYSQEIEATREREGMTALMQEGLEKSRQVAPLGFCASGDCVNEQQLAEMSAEEALASLAALGFGGQSMQEGLLFAGSVSKCRKDVVSYRNCCSDKGWGKPLGAECSRDEKALKEALQQQRCHYLGEYCAKREKLTHTCLKHKKSYCCYSSTLARLIQEGAHSQLNTAWPDAKHASCQGLTPTALSRLDFKHLDLSALKIPLQQRLQHSGQTLQQQRQAIENQLRGQS